MGVFYMERKMAVML